PLVGNDKYLFVHAQDQLVKLRLINYHLDNLINTSLKTISWTKEEREIILKAVNELADSMINAKHYETDKHQQQFRLLTELLWEDNEEITKNNNQHTTDLPHEQSSIDGQDR